MHQVWEKCVYFTFQHKTVAYFRDTRMSNNNADYQENSGENGWKEVTPYKYTEIKNKWHVRCFVCISNMLKNAVTNEV